MEKEAMGASGRGPRRDGMVAERGSVTRSSFAKVDAHGKIKAG